MKVYIGKNDDLKSLGNKFGVSKEVILISLVKLKKSTWNIYKQIKETWVNGSDDDRKTTFLIILK